MPPLPKPAATRQRTNKTTTFAKFEASAIDRIPNLPARDDGEPWHKLARAFWRDIQRSPMRAEYLQGDLYGLYVLADIYHRYWTCETTTQKIMLAAEIRQARMPFGLTPIDRRRLQWEIVKVEHAKTNPPAESRRRVTGDPRAVLHAVSA